MCMALLDGRAWTAGELARAAGVAPSTASEQLDALVSAGVLQEHRQGRHRYLRLANPEIASLIEELSGPPETPVGFRQVAVAQRLRKGRTCYDHLAGELGVSIYRSLGDHGLIDDGGLSDQGRQWFSHLLGPQCLVRQGRRPLVRSCIDWTERRPHLGGLLGALLASHCFGEGWVVPSRHDRGVALTPAGRDALARLWS
jgi:DNA-binding transcriptional ArsR family regulator